MQASCGLDNLVVGHGPEIGRADLKLWFSHNDFSTYDINHMDVTFIVIQISI